MDNTFKYLHLKHAGKSAYEIVDEIMEKYKSPIFVIKKIKEIFPDLGLAEAKEIVIIRTSEHKNLGAYQENLFVDLEELDRFMNEENENKNP